MKTVMVLMVIGLLLMFASGANAQIPPTISYQGVLCDASGNPKPDGTYSITFRLYTGATGGTAIWSETKSSLQVTRGLFYTLLGSSSLFQTAGVIFNQPYWLSIQVGTDAELSPRIAFASTPYTFHASNADTAGFAKAAGSGGGGSSPWQTLGTNIYYNSGRVGIGISSPVSRLGIQSTGTNFAGGFALCSGDVHTIISNDSATNRGFVQVTSGGNSTTIGPNKYDLLLDPYGGRVGIGTISPAATLEVDGSLLLSGTTGGTPASGFGTRLMWIPAKGAFRAGNAYSTEWDDANVGYYSTALGAGATTASGIASIAMGGHTTASGNLSTAMGLLTTASGINSTAMGLSTTASGYTSIAMGKNTTASNYASTAMGDSTTASGNYSTAMGFGTIANNTNSTAVGKSTTASNYASTAMGDSTTASGPYSTAMGYYSTASGNSSTAMGNSTFAVGVGSTAMGLSTQATNTGSTSIGIGAFATGHASTAIGQSVTASGDGSVAMGTAVSTNNYSGSFIFGDYTTLTVFSASAPDQFTAVFTGGYDFRTSRTATAGAYMNGGTSGWVAYCDRNKKENFRHVDGEELLQKVRSMSITEWNYKHTDPSIKYIGPVAQDFYAAFHLGGKDSLGINSICIDGVNMAAVQALEKRTAELRDKTSELQAKTAELEGVKSELADLKARLARVEHALSVPKDFTRRVSEETGSQR